MTRTSRTGGSAGGAAARSRLSGRRSHDARELCPDCLYIVVVACLLREFRWRVVYATATWKLIAVDSSKWGCRNGVPILVAPAFWLSSIRYTVEEWKEPCMSTLHAFTNLH